MNRSSRRLSTREYVEKELVCALVKRLFEISNPGVVNIIYYTRETLFLNP